MSNYILDNASINRMVKAINEYETDPPNEIIENILEDLQERLGESEGDPNCTHETYIEGAHDTRPYMTTGMELIEKRWGAWSPSKCVKCGKTSAKSNNGWEGKKDEDNELVDV